MSPIVSPKNTVVSENCLLYIPLVATKKLNYERSVRRAGRTRDVVVYDLSIY